MNFYEVASINLQDVNFAPESELAEIAQNILTIITTPKFSVPLDRDFGLEFSLLDSPLNVVKTKLTAQIAAAVKKFEPRALVTQVLYDAEPLSGKLFPRVRFKLVEKNLRSS